MNQGREKKTFLSKTRFFSGIRCPRLLWAKCNSPELLPPLDAASKFQMEEGKAVGKLAQRLFPGGIEVESGKDPERHHRESVEALQSGRPVFEAGFVFEQLYSVADIIVPCRGQYDLYEVKCVSNIRDEHLIDVSFQKYLYERAGIPVRKVFLVYLDNQYVRNGRLEPEKLFKLLDVTEAAAGLREVVEGWIRKLVPIMHLSEMPEVAIGEHCLGDPACPFKQGCWSFLPERDSVFVFSRGQKKALSLIEQGIYHVRDVPENFQLTTNQFIQKQCHCNCIPYIDKSSIRSFLKRLAEPIYYLDFETFNPAIPVYDNTRPFQQVPFQYSLQIIGSGERVQRGFIAQGDTDPRREILVRLKRLLGREGSIVAYNASFEKRTVRQALEAYPEFEADFSGFEARVIDLYEPFRKFHYYHPDQQGSGSMKYVLPALTGQSYQGMEIASGSQASREYYLTCLNPEVDETEKKRVLAALETYCHLDTRGMVDIVEVLRKQVG